MNKIAGGLLLSLFLSFNYASAEVNPESLVNILQRLDGLEKKVRELHGENEVLSHQLGQLKKAQKDAILNIDERIDTLSKPKSTNEESSSTTKTDKEETVKIVDYQPTSSTKKDSESPPLTPSSNTKKTPEKPSAVEKANPEKAEKVASEQEKESGKPRAPTAYEKETYQEAFNLMKTSPSAATKAFKDYIKLQPNSPLAANSQYWIAEIMYSHNNYKGAVQEFIKVLQNYNTSSKAPDAAIKLGYSFYALKNWPYARRTFEDVLKYFPDNKNAVTLANKRLEKMVAAGH